VARLVPPLAGGAIIVVVGITLMPVALQADVLGGDRAALGGNILLALASGCVHYQPQPLVPARTASNLQSRTLTDAGLRTFIETNAPGRVKDWPMEEWNFDTLTLAAFYYHPSLDVARAQLIAEVIAPALEAGQWVLCDRFTDSTEAYQGAGRRLGSDAVLQLHKVLCGGLWPDLTILMDCDVNSSVARARRRWQCHSHGGKSLLSNWRPRCPVRQSRSEGCSCQGCRRSGRHDGV